MTIGDNNHRGEGYAATGGYDPASGIGTFTSGTYDTLLKRAVALKMGKQARIK
jgi:hypothetical protein